MNNEMEKEKDSLTSSTSKQGDAWGLFLNQKTITTGFR